MDEAFSALTVTAHRGDDDLLSAGLGLEGLAGAPPSMGDDPADPDAAIQRRRAIWSNWRGMADLTAGGGYGEVYGAVPNVPGREFSALARLPGRHQPHRVLVQLPDGFDSAQRCLVVAPSSGSRGVYGAIAVAGPWALPKGCAVVYTDKGAGSDYYDQQARVGFDIEGRATTRQGRSPVYRPQDAHGDGVAFKHAHSLDNPEADWGLHVRQAAEFGLAVLARAHPESAPFTFANTRVIAVGISNGGGAVLQAAGLSSAGDDAPWLDAVVAGEPNVLPAHGGRALYDYATEAALLMPCALLGMQELAEPPPAKALDAFARIRCASLAADGLVSGADAQAQAADARRQLMERGWTAAGLRSGAATSGFDLWRAIAATYASAYGRYPIGAHPCGFDYRWLDVNGQPGSDPAQRASWWPEGSGIPPGNGIALLDSLAVAGSPDPALVGVKCLRALWDSGSEDAVRVQAGIEQTRARLPVEGIPVLVVHGLDDGLIPPPFSSAPYVEAARQAGREVRYWQVPHVQHFDAFLGLPGYGSRYLPLLPYVYRMLDLAWAHLRDGAGLPEDAVLNTRPRGAGQALSASHLGMPPQ